MTVVSNVYDAIRTAVQTLFPNKRELSDAIVIDNNDDLTLNDAYGIHFAFGNNTFRLVGCRYSLQRSVSIILTRMIRGTHKDIAKIIEIEKYLLEDQRTLVADFSENQNIGAVTIKRNYVSDGGIERIFTDKKNYIMIETTFEVEYLDDF